MRKVFAIILFIFAVPCLANSDEALISSAKIAVSKKLEGRARPSECQKWNVMASGGAISRSSALAKCDNDLNPAYGLVFSSLKTFHGAHGDSVCGIVSGRTEISKIGARFIYNARDNSVTMKPSKYPFYSLETSGELGKNQIKIENNQYKITKDLYCK